MNMLTRLIPLFLAGLLWLGVTSTASAAAPATEPQPDASEYDAYGVTCTTSSCTVDVPVTLSPLSRLGAQFAIRTVQENLNLLPDGASIELNDALTLELPVGDLLLTDADLVLTRTEEGKIQELRGTAQLPLPALGALENLALSGPIKADVGYARGADLAHLHAPLEADRAYVYFNFGSGLEMTVDQSTEDGAIRTIDLTVPKGQRATLVVDTQEPFAYLTGNLSLAYDEQLAVAGDLLNVMDAAGATTGIPVRHNVGVEWTTAVGQHQPAFLRLGGSYAADAGLVGRWLGVNLTPVTVRGAMTLNGDGMLLDGVAATEIFPETVLNGELYTQLYIPFDGQFGEAYVKLDGAMVVPSARATLAGSATVKGDLSVMADASITTPLYDNDGLVLVESDGDDARQRLAYVRTLADGAGNTMTRSYVYVRDASGDGLGWVRDGAAGGWKALAGASAASVDWTQDRWCGLTGLCGDAQFAVDEPIAVAASVDAAD